MAVNVATDSKTMFNYFTKVAPKACDNPRKPAPAFNKQHVEEFQNRLDQFDAELFSSQSTQSDQATPSSDYISTIKSGAYKPFRVVKKPRGPLRVHLLQYHEDVRPPYYGTWQRKSDIITGRRPFAMDDDVFDYDADSEAEWDIGGPGESLKGDDSEDEEELDDYEIDMKTFVPHGYVSDDEMEHSDQEEEQKSIDQNKEEICDSKDDSNSVQIVAEKGLKNNVSEQKHTNGNGTNGAQTHCNTTPQHPPVKQFKPIAIGLYYEPSQLTQSKLQFLNAFQGYSCA